MLDRFTETAKETVAKAKEIAQELHHQYISNEHLLHAMMNMEPCMAWGIIAGVDPVAGLVRMELGTVLTPSDEPEPKMVGFNEHVKRTVEKAFKRVEAMRFKWISTAFILLGIRESGSVTSEMCLSAWGLDADYILDRIKAFGDLNGSKESVNPFGSELDRKLWVLSGKFTEDVEKVLRHAQQLARTYQVPEINIYHLFLSLTFLAVREVVDVSPMQASKFNLEKVKKLVADKMGVPEEAAGSMQVFSPQVRRIMQHAVEESYRLKMEEVGVMPLASALMAFRPDMVAEGFGLPPSEVRRLLIRMEENPVHQVTCRTPPVKRTGAMPYPHLSARRYNADKGAVITIPEKLAREWGVIALDNTDDVLTIAMLNPEDDAVIRKVEELTGMRVAVIRTGQRDLMMAFRINY